MPTRKYQVAPIVATLLKILAVLLALVMIYLAIQQFGATVRSWAGAPGQPPFQPATPPVTGFGQRFVSLLQPLITLIMALGFPSLIWAIADGLLALRDIEFNTRADREVVPATTGTTVVERTDTGETL